MRSLRELETKVRTSINEYISGDIDLLMRGTDFCVVHGGAVYDSIKGNKINDVDIICSNRCVDVLTKNILSLGWKSLGDYSKGNISRSVFTHVLYSKIINCESRLIHVIECDVDHQSEGSSVESTFKEHLRSKFSIYTVSYSHLFGLSEITEGSIDDIKMGVFRTDGSSWVGSHLTYRTSYISPKLVDKGFKNWSTMSDSERVQLKLDVIL